jgi:hypothetical protein
MKTTLSIILASILCLLVVSSAQAAVLRVTIDYLTIQGAINAATPGDTVLIPAGVFNESLTINGKASIIIRGAGPGKTIIDDSATTNQNVINIVNASQIVITGLTIRNANNASNVFVENSSYITIIKNHIHGAFLDGIELKSASYIAIQYNVIAENGDTEGHGINQYGLSFANLFDNNDISSNAEDGIHHETGDYDVIRYNHISENSSHGVHNVGGRFITVHNNLIDNNGADGIFDEASHDLLSYIYYNVILNNFNSGIQVNSGMRIVQNYVALNDVGIETGNMNLIQQNIVNYNIFCGIINAGDIGWIYSNDVYFNIWSGIIHEGNANDATAIYYNISRHNAGNGLEATNGILYGNYSSFNTFGFSLFDNAKAYYNTAVNNYGDGFSYENQANTMTWLLYNLSYHNGGSGIYTTAGFSAVIYYNYSLYNWMNGIKVGDTCSVVGNYVADNTENGIDSVGTNGSAIAYNLIFNNGDLDNAGVAQNFGDKCDDVPEDDTWIANYFLTTCPAPPLP